MADFKDDFEESDEQELTALINRFEDMLKKGETLFFDAHELEEIVEHYIDLNSPSKLSKLLILH